MRKVLLGVFTFAVLGLVGGLLVQPPLAAQTVAADEAGPAPDFTHREPEQWLNSPPLSWADLRGKVVILEFWTFDCWNCYRSIPWLHTLGEKFPAAGFEIVGVHTPELPQEYVLANVRAKLEEFRIQGPVVVDNDYSTWKAWNNRYWPAFYLVDRQGRVRGRYVGETHAGDRNARAMEAQIADLLAEPAVP